MSSYRSGDYERAIADYSAAIKLDARYRRLRVNRGDAYQKQGEFERAVADYDAALRLDPDDFETSQKRARSQADYEGSKRLNGRP